MSDINKELFWLILYFSNLEFSFFKWLNDENSALSLLEILSLITILSWFDTMLDIMESHSLSTSWSTFLFSNKLPFYTKLSYLFISYNCKSTEFFSVKLVSF